MSGKELDKKLKSAGYVLADVARLLGVAPQSINQTLNAKDVKTGFLEDLCRVLDKDMSFFYDIPKAGIDKEFETVNEMQEAIEALQHENSELKVELIRLKNLKLPAKDSRVYNLWMKFMEITCEWQEMYKEEKEG